MSVPLPNDGWQQQDAPAGPPSLQVDLLSKGDSFATVADLRTAAERVLLSQGRTMVSDHRVTGGKSKLYRCAGSIIKVGEKGAGGCQVLVRAYKRKTMEWSITECYFTHDDNCVGGDKKPSLRAMAAEGAMIVNANRKITSPGLVKTLKGAYGVELKSHTANRLKRQIVGMSKKALNYGDDKSASPPAKLAGNRPETVVSFEVRTQTKRGPCACYAAFLFRVLISNLFYRFFLYPHINTQTHFIFEKR